MPPPISRRELRRQQEFENDLAQQQGDQRAQAGLMQMLESLYGIGERQQFAPARLQALESETEARRLQNARLPEMLQSQLETAAQARRLAESQEGRAAEIHPLQRDRGVFENEALNLRLPYLQPAAQAEIEASRASTEATRARTGMLPDEIAALRSRTAAQQFENQWAQPRAEQDFRAGEGRIDATKALAGQREQISPNAIPYLVSLGIITKEEAQDLVLTPEMRAKRQQRASLEEAQREAERNREAAMLQQTGPTSGETNASYYGRAVGRGLNFYSRYVDPVHGPIRRATDWLRQPKR